MEAVLFGYEDCAPSHAYGPTLRPYHLFHFVTSGQGILQIDDSTFSVYAGDAFLIPAEQMSYYEASSTDPWSYSWAGMTGLRATQYVQNILTAAPERYVLRNLDIAKYAASIKKAAVLKETSAANYFLCETIIYELFFFLSQEVAHLTDPGSKSELATKIKFYIDAKYTEKLRLDELADRFAIHPNHLSRVFREAYGIAPKQYLQNLKLEKSAQMLSSSNMPIRLIAESLGFEDQHSFSKAFKKYRGVSPRDYRKG